MSMWENGDVLYIKEKAQRGILDRVAIKKVLTATNEHNYMRDIYPVYRDTFNAYWNEEDLVTEDVANTLVAEYEAWLAEQLEELEE